MFDVSFTVSLITELAPALGVGVGLGVIPCVVGLLIATVRNIARMS